MAQVYDTMPYGELINGPAQPNELVLFTGKPRDLENGWDDFGSRKFSSVLCRWTSPDQLVADNQMENPQSWNLYCYVKNNPIYYVDPTGLWRVEFTSNWSEEEKYDFRVKMVQVKAQAEEIIAELDKLINMLPDAIHANVIEAAQSMRDRVQGVVDDINSDKALLVDKQDLGVNLGGFVDLRFDPQPGYSQFAAMGNAIKKAMVSMGLAKHEMTLNSSMPITPQVIFHELLHFAGADDGGSDWYNEAYQIDVYMGQRKVGYGAKAAYERDRLYRMIIENNRKIK